MANFSRLIELSETINESPTDILRKAMQSNSLVVAKVPLCDIYLLAQRPNLIAHRPTLTATTFETRLTKKIENARWLVLTHFDIEEIIEYGQVDIDEFRTLAYERGDEGILQENAPEAARSLAKEMKLYRSNPSLSDSLAWRESIFIFSKKSPHPQEDKHQDRIRETFKASHLYIESNTKIHLSKYTSKNDKTLDANQEDRINTIDKPQWMSHNLYILNITSEKYFSGEPKIAKFSKELRKQIEAELKEKLRNGKYKYGVDKIKDAIDFITPDHLRRRSIMDKLENVPNEKPHHHPQLSSILKIMNKLSKDLWETHTSSGKIYPPLKDTEIVAHKVYGIGTKAAKCFASMITPD